jgi:hypothetical protein
LEGVSESGFLEKSVFANMMVISKKKSHNESSSKEKKLITGLKAILVKGKKALRQLADFDD